MSNRGRGTVALCGVLAGLGACGGIAEAAHRAGHEPTLVPLRLYGGGWLPSRYTASTGPIAFVNAIRHGGVVRFFADVNGTCNAGGRTFHQILSFYPRVRLRGSRFAGTGTTAADGSQGTPGMTYRLTGRAVSSSRVVGSVQVLRGSYTAGNGTHVTCSSRRYGYTALDPTQRGLSGRLVAGGVYYGNQYTPGNRFPFMLEVRRGDRRRIEIAAVESIFHCSSGVPVPKGQFFYQNLVHDDAIRPDASFRDVDDYTEDIFGYTAVVHSVISGRFARRALTGRWRIDATVSNPAHLVVGTCTTGSMPLRAAL